MTPSEVVDKWIRRNYAHDVTFDLAPELQSLIAAAVAAEREANRRAMQQLIDAAHNAIAYVGAANYPEREEEAHQRIVDIDNAIFARNGSK